MTVVLSWLVLVTTLIAGCSTSSDLPDIDAAVMGFNSILANSCIQPDPGFRQQIFEPYTRPRPANFERIHVPAELSSFIKVVNFHNCKPEFKTVRFSNYNSYRQWKVSSYIFSLEAREDNVFAYFQSSVGYGMDDDEEDIAVKKFFQHRHAELIISRVECITRAVTIGESTSPKKFTKSFDEAMQILQKAAMDPRSIRSKYDYLYYIERYGTHFLKKTYLGAKLSFERRFTSKLTTIKQSQDRLKCVEDSARASVMYSALGIDKVKNKFSTVSRGCNESPSANNYFNENSIQPEMVSSVGLMPGETLEEWAQIIVDPVAIRFEIEPLSIFFSTRNDNNFNGTNVNLFLREMSQKYCTMDYSKNCATTSTTTATCTTTPPTTTSTTTPPPSGFETCSCEEACSGRCVTIPTLYGGAIIAGGWDGRVFLSSTEAIATYQRPPLPAAVEGASLTRVGDMLYSCGGRTGTGRTATCHTLDTLSSAPVWSETVRLPVGMVYHTAVTVGEHIWFAYHSQLHSLNTQTNTFKTFSLPFTVTSYHCAVGNDTHSYVIAAGSGEDEVWVNSVSSSPAQWSKVTSLPRHGQASACLWSGGNSVVITGGRPGSKAYTSILNTDTNTIAEAADMLQGRSHHQMMVLDGKPAVVGGYGGSNLNSIESYDTVTDKWQRHDIELHTERSSFALAQLAG